MSAKSGKKQVVIKGRYYVVEMKDGKPQLQGEKA